MELPTGYILNNRFRIIRLLGQGGMGSVYHAHDPVLDRYVAVKQLLPPLMLTEHEPEQMRKQFLREAQTLAGLHHPNLPRVTDYFIDNDLHYLVMDYIEGQTLQDMLAANKTGFPENLVLEWADQLLSALEYIHTCNVIHRDIKPANIRRTTGGHLFLVDFGLVKPYNLNNPRTLTMFHGIGTLEYAPPEQYDPEAHTDQRSDIYSLGATLYHLLTGQTPVSVTRRTSDPTSFHTLRQANADISPEVEAVILRAMEIERAKRFPSALDMHAALNLIRQTRAVDLARTTSLIVAPIGTVPARPDDRKRGQRILVTIGVLVLLAAGILIGFALQSSTTTVQSASTPTAATEATDAHVLTPTASATTSPSPAPSATSASTATATAQGTTTLPTGTPALQTTDGPAATAQSQPTLTQSTAPTSIPTPKIKITPPGQIKPKDTPPGQANPKDPPPGKNKDSAATSAPDAGSSNPGGSNPGGGSSGDKPPKSK
jgi:eukaryotic-like serine/threonine-protein kinase